VKHRGTLVKRVCVGLVVVTGESVLELEYKYYMLTNTIVYVNTTGILRIT